MTQIRIGHASARALALSASVALTGALFSGCGGAEQSSTPPKLKPAAPHVRLHPRQSAAVTHARSGSLVAILAHRTALLATPGGRELASVQSTTEFGSPQYLLVVAHRAGWLGVLSPLLANGQVGWIARSATTLVLNPWELEVSLASRRLTVLRDHRVIQRVSVAIGPPQTPTPTGRFAVTDRLVTRDPTGPYGCCILALTAHAPHAIQGWSGGTRIAIHSTPDSASIGEAVSHGCVRVTLAEGRWLMDHIPLATPTLISS